MRYSDISEVPRLVVYKRKRLFSGGVSVYISVLVAAVHYPFVVAGAVKVLIALAVVCCKVNYKAGVMLAVSGLCNKRR